MPISPANEPGRAREAKPALVAGGIGLVWAVGGRPRIVFGITIRGEKIVGIDLVADPERIGQLEPVVISE